MKFDPVVVSMQIKAEAVYRIKLGVHHNLTQAIYEVFGEIAHEIDKLMEKANIEERNRNV